jgi:hypothetical protein
LVTRPIGGGFEVWALALSPLVVALLGARLNPGPVAQALGFERPGDAVVAALRRGLSVEAGEPS